MTKTNNRLERYKEKRDFQITPEPGPKVKAGGKLPIFVIQEHAARSLHYDFRIENEGVLLSWAIPKGPSTDPSKKHLAIQTEDHPYDYKDFEGVIPKGEYGAGPVMVWDKGTYHNLREVSITESLREGRIAIWLNGKKLKGGYALVKTHYGGNPNSWIFFKMKDDEADASHDILQEKPDSALTGRSMEEISES